MNKEKIWTSFALVFLGLWLLLIHTNFNYFHPEMRISDVITGFLVLGLSFLTFSTRKTWPRWIICLLGIWLQFAPLVFWAKSRVAYLNDTMVGILLVSFSILIPRIGDKVKGYGEIPAGWSYNPSAWSQRVPILFLASICWFITQHLEAFQLGFIQDVWDPFFKDGTVKVLTSSVSGFFPVSDAGLGSMAYLIESLMVCKGDACRWRTMPWIVFLFGILVIPLGIISIILVMLQPIAVGAWCTLCLLTAFAMLLMITLTIDEVLASIEFLQHSRKAGHSFWGVFWKGGDAKGSREEKPLVVESFEQKICYAFRGVDTVWSLFVCALIGIWIIFVPNIVDTPKPDYYSILGPLVFCVSVLSLAEIIRKLRYLNVIFAIILLVLAWFSDRTFPIIANHLIVALPLAILTLFHGPKKEKYGRWT
ncbi:MAG: vitamin K epoxide reductase family protein [Chlamydiae bacterium]|nr:vitamin K epoxide reductase family protein [Chlamydiota bacterium]